MSSLDRPPSRGVTRYIQWRIGGAVDGIWGTNTDAAIKVYQSSNDLTPDGIIGPETWNKLLSSSDTSPQAAAPPVQGTGNEISNLQSALNTLKIRDNNGNPLVVDAIIGQHTREAVMNFQSVVGIQVDGIAGQETWRAINAILSRPVSSIKQTPSREVTRYIQWRVGTAADGIWGTNTDAAVKNYQRNNGLAADGVVGAQTWEKLLG